MPHRTAWIWIVLGGIGLATAGCADDTSGPDATGEDAGTDGGGDVPPADVDDDAEGAPGDGADGEAGEGWEGGTCTTHEQCSDGQWCNGAERCEGGVCMSGADPCDDRIDCTVDSCDDDIDRCFHTGDNSLCQDDLACNGEEQCLATGCSTGTRPNCADSSPCTIDTCDETRGGCVHDPRDFDRDGYMTRDYGCDAEGGTDCNDSDASVHPDAVEVCDDIRDNNCDTVADFADPACRPVNDRCTGALLLEEGVAVNSSTRGTVHDYSPACCTYCSYTDVAFQLDLDETLDIIVEVTSRSGTVYVDLQRTCGVNSTSLRCLSGSSVTLRRNSQPAGSYFIIVDGNNADFTITYHTEGPTPIPPNDVCTGAIDVPAAGGTISGSLLDTSNHYVPTCAGTRADPDAFYRLVLTEPHRVIISASLTPTVSTTYVSLMGECGVSASEIACAGGATARITRNFLDTGTYYIAVDGSAENPFTLTVTLEPPVYPPANDTCAGAEDVPATGGIISGTLLSASDHYIPACAGTGRYPDAFYRLVLTEPHKITVTAQLTPTTTATYVSLATECGVAATEIACTGGATATITRNFLDVGTYYIAVDASTENPFTLNVLLEAPIYPPANDRCPGDDVTGGGTFVGTMLETYRDYPPSCSTATLSDVVYQFTLTDPQDVSVGVTPVGTATTYVAALRTTCDDHTTELACRAGNPAQFFRHSLAAGAYYIMVSGPTAAPGNQFVLQVTMSPPTPVPPGDVCLGATDVSAGGTFLGSTLGCEDDYAPTCGSTLAYSDLVYSLSLAAPQEVTIDLGSAAPTAYLDVRNGTCGSGTSSVSCTSGATAHFFNRNLPAGDYWILVDTSMEGATTLDVGIAPPSSACDGSTVINVDYTAGSTFVYTDSATTAGRPDDFDPSCIYGAYPDYPYSLVVPVRSAVSVATDTTTYDGSLHMRSACDVPSSEIGCNDDCGSTRRSCVPSSGTLTLEPGTYTIIVDGYGGSGDFTITVTATRL